MSQPTDPLGATPRGSAPASQVASLMNEDERALSPVSATVPRVGFPGLRGAQSSVEGAIGQFSPGSSAGIPSGGGDTGTGGEARVEVVRPSEREDVIIRSMTSPPPSGEAPIDFDVLVARVREALPTDLPRDPRRIMVALDLDGTILTGDGISTRVRETLDAATDAGIHVVIATGRSLGATIPVLEDLDARNMSVVCSNGALRLRVGDVVDEAVVGQAVRGGTLGAARDGVVGGGQHRLGIDDAQTRGAWERRLGRNGASVLVNDPMYFEPATLIDLLVEGIPGLRVGVETLGGYVLSEDFPPGELIEAHRVVSVEELRATPAIKLIIRQPELTRRQFDGELTRLGVKDSWECSVGWTSWADILPKGVTKDSGLEVLAQQLGVPHEGTVAVGDGTNDISMIRWANFGVVMGGANDEVRVHGDHVTGAVENDGAGAVIEAILRRSVCM
ncbi:HAD family hydrolase [Schaalia sp. ZJ1691]|uniref:HAD hydrolase family protein n=1 Tax=Schaalia sp. ZJ1691 TaxID=2709404 RepID=UPI0013EBD40C|nr:HAD family hydrolase [Schaalia sp. ZJ1691]